MMMSHSGRLNQTHSSGDGIANGGVLYQLVSLPLTHSNQKTRISAPHDRLDETRLSININSALFCSHPEIAKVKTPVADVDASLANDCPLIAAGKDGIQSKHAPIQRRGWHLSARVISAPGVLCCRPNR
jgi:hypothetical protein